MMRKILACSIRAICAGGMALGMTMAMAQDASITLQHVNAVDGERLVLVAYSDPEGEISNGTNPNRAVTHPEVGVGSDVDEPMETDNFSESEVGNGIDPPMYAEMAYGERSTEMVIAYSDPEGEVGNGTDPPDPNFIDPEIEVDWEVDPSTNISNFPESEISNGIDPPM
ncbi:hypothetical protein [Massilia oculi]|uniref:hypothetical protein n=1 Tax=Massilia oculi TaxID=945844 RepID=UPI0028ABECD8|nr:hypothetical protein [Massilia oculi]